MEDDKKEAPAGMSPTSANEINNDKGNVFNEVSDESVILYRSWFECLKEQGIKRFALAMIALLSYAFYGDSVKSFGLPRQLEAIIETFTPVIETNKKRRNGGNKGGHFGKNGGRPTRNADSKTPKGLPNKTPMEAKNETPMDTPYTVNGTVTGNVNENDTVSVTGTDTTVKLPLATSPHTDFDFFISIFFFRNIVDPNGECQRFLDYYSASDWTLQGGQQLDTDEKRIAKARNWNPNNPGKRCSDGALCLLKQLFDIAPDYIKTDILHEQIIAKTNGQRYEIHCTKTFHEWLVAPDLKEHKKEILQTWSGGQTINFSKIS